MEATKDIKFRPPYNTTLYYQIVPSLLRLTYYHVCIQSEKHILFSYSVTKEVRAQGKGQK